MDAIKSLQGSNHFLRVSEGYNISSAKDVNE
jgi:hypothetical protein